MAYIQLHVHVPHAAMCTSLAMFVGEYYNKISQVQRRLQRLQAISRPVVLNVSLSLTERIQGRENEQNRGGVCIVTSSSSCIDTNTTLSNTSARSRSRADATQESVTIFRKFVFNVAESVAIIE